MYVYMRLMKSLCLISLLNKLLNIWEFTLQKIWSLDSNLTSFQKLKKTKSILNMWLQRDLSIFGRVLLFKMKVYQGLLILLCQLFLTMHFVKKSIVYLLILFGKIDTTISRKKFLV